MNTKNDKNDTTLSFGLCEIIELEFCIVSVNLKKK